MTTIKPFDTEPDLPPDEVIWDLLPEWVKYLARDKSEEVVAYESRPTADEDWFKVYCGGCEYLSDLTLYAIGHKNNGRPWDQSLIERPTK